MLPALALSLVVACAPVGHTAPPTSAPPSTGCADHQPATAPGTTAAQSLTSGGRDRIYLLRIPTNYHAGQSVPLILAFHGRGRSDQMLETYSNLDTLPSIVAYPQGTPTTGGELGWQGTPYSAPGVDDVLFTRDLIDQVQQRFCVDIHRIYATGKSNGAGFVGNQLACQMANRIAAVAGAYYETGQPCQPQRPEPVLEFHGTADTVVPYDGVAERHLPPIPQWLTDWAHRDGCTTGPDTIYQHDDVTGQHWSNCRDNSTIEHYRVTGGGHTWPGATSNSGPGPTTTTIQATQLIWQFFTAHPLDTH